MFFYRIAIEWLFWVLSVAVLSRRLAAGIIAGGFKAAKSRKALKKKPKHVCLVVDFDRLHFLQCIGMTSVSPGSSDLHPLLLSIVDAIQYLISLEITHITLYDQQGHLKNSSGLLIRMIADSMLRRFDADTRHSPVSLPYVRLMSHHKVLWEPTGWQSYANKSKRDFTVYLSDASDGKDAIASIARELCRSAYNPNRDSFMELIEERLADEFPIYSNPDLVYIIGGGLQMTLNDLSPWSIRLSEFYHIPCVKWNGCLDLRDIDKGILKYANCEQRFGK